LIRLGGRRCAIGCYEECVQLAHELGNAYGKAAMLVKKGSTLHELGKRDEAIEACTIALEIFERLKSSQAMEIRKLLDEWSLPG